MQESNRRVSFPLSTPRAGLCSLIARQRRREAAVIGDPAASRSCAECSAQCAVRHLARPATAERFMSPCLIHYKARGPTEPYKAPRMSTKCLLLPRLPYMPRDILYVSVLNLRTRRLLSDSRVSQPDKLNSFIFLGKLSQTGESAMPS